MIRIGRTEEDGVDGSQASAGGVEGGEEASPMLKRGPGRDGGQNSLANDLDGAV